MNTTFDIYNAPEQRFATVCLSAVVALGTMAHRDGEKRKASFFTLSLLGYVPSRFSYFPVIVPAIALPRGLSRFLLSYFFWHNLGKRA